MISKIKKENLVNTIIYFLKKSNMKAKSIAHLIRAIHFGLPFICFFLLLTGKFYLAMIGVAIIVKSVFAFFILEGCYMSMIENKLLGDTFTVVDPMLEFLHFDVTRKSRYYITIVMSNFYMIIYGLIFYIMYLSNDISF